MHADNIVGAHEAIIHRQTQLHDHFKLHLDLKNDRSGAQDLVHAQFRASKWTPANAVAYNM